MTQRRNRYPWAKLSLATAGLLAASAAHASMFKGETLDAVANAMSWIVLFIVPIVCIAAFWLVHILPEKIAEKNNHPQAKAIHTLCLLSLFFGGLLWPLAWLWAYTKPVLYKMAYGTDTGDGHGQGADKAPLRKEPAVDELAQLRSRLASLEAQVGKGDRS